MASTFHVRTVGDVWTNSPRLAHRAGICAVGAQIFWFRETVEHLCMAAGLAVTFCGVCQQTGMKLFQLEDHPLVVGSLSWG